MKIQLWHSREHDFIKELYNPIKESIFYKKHKFIFPHDKENIFINSKESLKDVDIFLCEVSNNSIGLWIEIWFADLYKKRIICFYKKWTNVSWSLKYITNDIIEYKDSSDLINEMGKFLTRT